MIFMRLCKKMYNFIQENVIMLQDSTFSTATSGDLTKTITADLENNWIYENIKYADTIHIN